MLRDGGDDKDAADCGRIMGDFGAAVGVENHDGMKLDDEADADLGFVDMLFSGSDTVDTEVGKDNRGGRFIDSSNMVEGVGDAASLDSINSFSALSELTKVS